MRPVSAAFGTEVNRLSGARPMHLMEADFGTLGWARFWTGIGPLSWNGVTWSGSGELIAMGTPKETFDRQRHGISFTLASRDYFDAADYVEVAMSENVQGNEIFLWYGYRDDYGNVVSDPICVFHGEISGMRVQEDLEKGISIVMEAEQELRDTDRSQRYRITAASQAERDPTDKGLEFMGQLATMTVDFGSISRNRVQEP